MIHQNRMSVPDFGDLEDLAAGGETGFLPQGFQAEAGVGELPEIQTNYLQMKIFIHYKKRLNILKMN